MKSKSGPDIPDDPVSLANRVNEYFTSVGSSASKRANELVRVHNSHINLTMPTTMPMPDCSDIFRFHPVMMKDVECVIKSFSSNKAPGHDKISARVLKDSLPATLPIIASIMNNSFHTKHSQGNGKLLK